MGLSRRHLIHAASGALALSSVGVSAQANGPSGIDDPLYPAAKKEGQLTWYSGILDQPLCVQVGQAFSAKYPGIEVKPIKNASQVALQRLMQDIKAGSMQADVFTTTDIGHVTFLNGKSLLVPYVAPSVTAFFPTLRSFNGGGLYQVSWIGQVTIIYNTMKVKLQDAPQDWPDLTNPKWANAITFGSPNYSGLVGVWTVAMAQRYGWDYFEKLNKLNPLIGRSIDDAGTVLNSGERMVAAGNPASALRSAARGNPLGVIYPTSGTLASPSPTVILKGSPSPNAAKLFVEFLAGREYSQILADNFEQPMRADVSLPKGSKSMAEINTFVPTPDEIEKQLGLNKEKWRDTFGG